MTIPKNSKVLWVCPTLMTVAMAVGVISLATDSWVVERDPFYDFMEVRVGLFEICTDDICFKIDDCLYIYGDQSLIITRGFMICSVIVSCFCLVMTLRFSCVHRTISTKSYAWICCGLALLATVLSFAGVGYFVYDQELYNIPDAYTYRYGYSMHFGWLSGAIMFISGFATRKVVHYYFVQAESRSSLDNVVHHLPDPNVQQDAVFSQASGTVIMMSEGGPAVISNGHVVTKPGTPVKQGLNPTSDTNLPDYTQPPPPYEVLSVLPQDEACMASVSPEKKVKH